MKNTISDNLVESLIRSSPSKDAVSRCLAEMGLGIITALQQSQISFEQARLDLFNLENYKAARRHRLSPDTIRFFEWAMEFEDVTEIAPDALAKSYQQAVHLAQRIIGRTRSKTETAGARRARNHVAAR